MTSKATVKANAGNFAFYGNDGNEGWQGQATNGAAKQCRTDRTPIPSASGENHFTVLRTGEMGYYDRRL
jgi:hypothetical protein